jgi:hypothetical protein
LAVWVAEVASQRGEEAAEMTGGLHEEGETQAEEDGVDEKSVEVEAGRGWCGTRGASG